MLKVTRRVSDKPIGGDAPWSTRSREPGMNSKVQIIAVLGLGLVAALCAAVLMAALRSGNGRQAAAPKEAEIVVAAADIAPFTLLQESHLATKVVPVSDIPEGAMRSTVKALGRVPKVALVAGQALTERSLLEENSGARLASSLPDGARAVSVELTPSAAMRGLIYPGCRVDVLVAYARHSAAGSAQGPAETLLQNVPVLAIGDETVFSGADEAPAGKGEAEKPAPAKPSNERTMMVTLLVQPEQARNLQAARERGQLSLSLRNPLDSSLTAEKTDSANAPVAATVNVVQVPAASVERVAPPTVVLATPAATLPDVAVQRAGAPGAAVDALPEVWEVRVIRGSSTEVVSFERRSSRADKPAGPAKNAAPPGAPAPAKGTGEAPRQASADAATNGDGDEGGDEGDDVATVPTTDDEE